VFVHLICADESDGTAAANIRSPMIRIFIRFTSAQDLSCGIGVGMQALSFGGVFIVWPIAPYKKR
jgi:hypothetical protein